MDVILTTITKEELTDIIQSATQAALANINFRQAENVQYLTRSEVAAMLHISLPTLNQYTKDGTLKGYRIHGRVIYRVDEIDQALMTIGDLKYKRRK